MVGKAYTMKELRTIVDYLKTRNAYGQIKGKKIWVDLESSSLTDRTWQSLKEAFLKRILPDIVNPYYKLSREEIASFRVGHSMIKSRGHKLDVKRTPDSTKKINTVTIAAEVHNDPKNSHPDTDKNDVVEIKDTITIQTTGENTASATVDTLNSNNCYQTAQDIIKDLLSSTEDNDQEEDTPEGVSKKKQSDVERTTSSLNPVLREILHDFDSDSSEIVLTIDENVINNDKDNVNGESISKTGENNAENDKNVEGTKTNKPVDSTKAAVDESNITVQSINNNNSTNNIISGDSSLPCNQEILSKTDTTTDDLPIEKKSKIKLGKRKNNEKPIDMENKLIPDDKCEHNQDNKVVSNISEQPVEGPSTSKDAPSAIADNINDNLSDTEKSPQKKAKTTKVSITKSLKRKNKEVIIADKEDILSIHIISDNESEVENTEKRNSPIENLTEVSNTKSLKRKHDDGNTADKEDNPANNAADDEFEIEKTGKKMSSIENNNNKVQDVENSAIEETNLNISKPTLTSTKVDEVKEKVRNPEVLLPSHSESSESEIDKVPKRVKTKKSDRLSRLFGFSSDAINLLMPNTRPKVHTTNGGKSVVVPSSDSENDTDAEMDEQPSIIKWKPDKGPPLENQIFVVYNGKLYPLIKKMDNIASYCQYQPRGEENESFWQKKFIEEKKRSAELARLFQETDENNMKKKEETITKKTETENKQVPEASAPEKIVQGKAPCKENAAHVHNCNNEEKTVIKFKSKKDDSEITLEGRWQNLQPIVSEVMQMFHGDNKTPKVDTPKQDNTASKIVEEKENNDVKENNENITEYKIDEKDTKKSDIKEVDLESNTSKSSIGSRKKKAPVPKIVVTSATPTEHVKKPNPRTSRKHESTPVPEIVDEEALKARERVKQLEADIFKEIEEKDKLMNEQTIAEDKSSKEAASDSNVNLRKRRQPLRYSKEVVDNNNKRLKLVKDKSNLELPIPKRKARSTKKSSNETNSDGASVKGIAEDPSTIQSSIYNDDSDTKYKFPSPEPEPSDIEVRKRALASMKNKLKRIRRRNRKNRSRHSSKANASFGSIDSLQDSDSNDSELSSDRKSKMSISMRKMKYPIQQERRLGRTRKTSMVYRKNNTEANPIKESNVQVSKLDSKIYRTESYELLMNNKTAIAALYKGKETVTFDTLSPASQTMSGSNCSRLDIDKSVSTLEVEVDNSTNSSCPTSPELSIVENISINRDLMEFINTCDDINDHISDNDTSNPEELRDNNVRHMSIVAANIDMMDQKFDIIETSEAFKQKKVLDESMPSAIRETPVRSQMITRNMRRRSNQTLSDSVLDKIKTVDINEPTASESLNEQICNLVIDSAKKQKSSQRGTRNKQKPNSRSSTPHRKKISSESNTLGVHSVIDECMEYCSLRTKRNSCPPNIASTHDDESQIESQNVTKSRGGSVKKKKNILKVKIVRPKHKNLKKPASSANNGHDVTIPDMLHNNSNSCVSQKYLEDESVILVEQNNDSVISINSFEPASCAISDNTSNEKAIENDCFFGNTHNTRYSLEPANCVVDDSVLEVNIDNAINKSSLSFFSNDAQEAAKVGTSKSTLSNNSFLTEDISDEILNQSPTSPNSNWYLFSEDEISNMSPPGNTDLIMKQSNEYMKKLFPVVCEVPDLSTITEASHDIDNLKNNKESGAGTN